MRLLNVKGNLVTKNVSKYLIDWDAPSKSQLQFRVKQFFKPYWLGAICYEEFPVYGTQLKVDLLNATMRIAVEINGPQHYKFHYFHNKNPQLYLDAVKNDLKKSDWLLANEFKIIEINFKEVDALTPDYIKEKFDLSL
jgi:hypothetical protein